MGRRWIKLWVNEWLSGTTRFDLTMEERAIWVDLLALAGSGRVPGVVASGREADGTIRGYPVLWLSGHIMCSDDMLLAALEKFKRSGKVVVENIMFGNCNEIVIHISNWEKYQSEYERISKYRESGSKQKTIGLDTQKVQKKYAQGTKKVRSKYFIETEGETESEGEPDTEGEENKEVREIKKEKEEKFQKVHTHTHNNKNKLLLDIINTFGDEYQRILGIPYDSSKVDKIMPHAERVAAYLRKTPGDGNGALLLHRHMVVMFLLHTSVDDHDKYIVESGHSLGAFAADLMRWAKEALSVPLISSPEDIGQLPSVHGMHPKVERQISILEASDPEIKRQCYKIKNHMLKKERGES